jgi:hypothetical protein
MYLVISNRPIVILKVKACRSVHGSSHTFSPTSRNWREVPSTSRKRTTSRNWHTSRNRCWSRMPTSRNRCWLIYTTSRKGSFARPFMCCLGDKRRNLINIFLHRSRSLLAIVSTYLFLIILTIFNKMEFTTTHKT